MAVLNFEFSLLWIFRFPRSCIIKFSVVLHEKKGLFWYSFLCPQRPFISYSACIFPFFKDNFWIVRKGMLRWPYWAIHTAVWNWQDNLFHVFSHRSCNCLNFISLEVFYKIMEGVIRILVLFNFLRALYNPWNVYKYLLRCDTCFKVSGRAYMRIKYFAYAIMSGESWTILFWFRQLSAVCLVGEIFIVNQEKYDSAYSNSNKRFRRRKERKRTPFRQFTHSRMDDHCSNSNEPVLLWLTIYLEGDLDCFKILPTHRKCALTISDQKENKPQMQSLSLRIKVSL